jgi:hypothetical protein
MEDTTVAVDKIARPLIAAGEDLLRRTQMDYAKDSELPKDISGWIYSAIDELLVIMPEECPEYAEIAEIRSRHADNQSILLPSSGDDIRKVLKDLCIARNHMVTAMKAEWRDIPPENLAHIYYEQHKQSVDYVKSEVVNRLIGKEDGRTRKTAILHIYGRIYMWTRSMARLDGIGDCLALAGCLRALLELFIDLKLMNRGTIPDDVEKYFSFERINKWHKAQAIAKNRDTLGLTGDESSSAIDQYIKQGVNEEGTVRTLEQRFWGLDKKGKPRNPAHWTDKPIAKRVELLKDDRSVVEIYDASYYYCNCLVHSTYSDLTRDANNVHLFNGHLYTLGDQMFLAATRLTNGVAAGISSEDLETHVEQIHRRSLKAYIGELVRAGRRGTGKEE